ncbi:MAG: hypothetical protein RLZZ484_2018 [Pseudomonadota bacterium]|jgi:hypothetical protein
MNISNLSKHALLSWCLLFYVQIVWGQEAGTMTRVSGKATVTSLENATREAKANDPVSVGEIVTTDTGAEVLIRFKDNSTMIVRSASKLKISQFRFEKKATDTSQTSLLSGTLRAVSGQIAKAQPSNVKYDAGAATIGIRGTDIEVAIVPEGAKDRAGIYNYVHSGETEMKLETGESAVVSKELTGFSPETLLPGETRLQVLRDRPAFLQSGGFDALLQQLTAPRIPMIR